MALVSHIGEWCCVTVLVCYTAIFSVVMQCSSRHNTKHCCGCVADETDIGYSMNIALVSHIGEGRCVTILVCYTDIVNIALGRFPFVRTGRPDHCRISQLTNEIGFFQRVFAEKNIFVNTI